MTKRPRHPKKLIDDAIVGAAAFADPNAGIDFAYVLNRMRMDLEDRRDEDLAAAVYAALA